MHVHDNSIRYDTNNKKPHSRIFRDKSLKILKSKPGARYSAINRMGFVHGAHRDSVLTAGRPLIQ
jgi:hypothetical protein